jgi:uncharacterized protein
MKSLEHPDARHPLHELGRALGPVISGQPEVAFLVLLGSRARGTATVDSDWDFGVQFKSRADRSGGERLAVCGHHETLRRAIATVLGQPFEKIDLIDLSRAGLALRAEAAEHGFLLSDPDPLAWSRFLLRVWRELEQFEWERTHAA